MTTYRLRHSFATHFVANDYGSRADLQEILGHASVRTSMDNFVHPDRRSMKKAMNKAAERMKNGLKKATARGKRLKAT